MLTGNINFLKNPNMYNKYRHIFIYTIRERIFFKKHNFFLIFIYICICMYMYLYVYAGNIENFLAFCKKIMRIYNNI